MVIPLPTVAKMNTSYVNFYFYFFLSDNLWSCSSEMKLPAVPVSMMACTETENLRKLMIQLYESKMQLGR